MSREYLKTYLDDLKLVNPFINQNSYDLYNEYIKQDVVIADIAVRVLEDLYTVYSTANFGVIGSVYKRTWSPIKPFVIGSVAYAYGSRMFPKSIVDRYITDEPSDQSYPVNYTNVSISKDFISYPFGHVKDKFVGLMSVAVKKDTLLTFKHMTRVSGTAANKIWVHEFYEPLKPDDGAHPLDAVISPFVKIVSSRDVGGELLGGYL